MEVSIIQIVNSKRNTFSNPNKCVTDKRQVLEGSIEKVS